MSNQETLRILQETLRLFEEEQRDSHVFLCLAVQAAMANLGLAPVEDTPTASYTKNESYRRAIDFLASLVGEKSFFERREGDYYYSNAYAGFYPRNSGSSRESHAYARSQRIALLKRAIATLKDSVRHEPEAPEREPERPAPSLIVTADEPALLFKTKNEGKVYIGSALVPQARLRELGVKLYVCLTAKGPYIIEPGETMLVAPIVDGGVPKKKWMERLVNYIEEAWGSGESVYIHCLAGLGRTGIVAACYLIEHCGYSSDEALAKVAELRGPSCPETNTQKAFVHNYYEVDYDDE